MNARPARRCDCHLCRPEVLHDAVDRRTVDTVRRFGWQVMLVSDDVECSCPDHDGTEPAGHSDVPAFAYTVGLMHGWGHPELLISGLDVRLMHGLLNDVATRVSKGRRLAPGDVLEGVLGHVPVVMERATQTAVRETVTHASWFQRRRVEALVVVWPTTAGIFAWQPGAPEALDRLQPPAWRLHHPHVGSVEVVPPWEFPVPEDRRAFSCTHVVEDGEPVLWLARQSDSVQDEDWSLHCGKAGHTVDEMCMVHLAHLVRSSPGVRAQAGLALDHEAWRDDVDAPWQVSAIDTT